VLGTTFWSVYGAYGLSALPWILIKGKKSLEQEKSELSTDLSMIRDKYRTLQEKYIKSHSKVSRSD